MGSLRLCDTKTQGPRQNTYLYRSGFIYQYLGNIYGQAYKYRGGESVKKNKRLNLCRLYYEKSVKVFKSIEEASVEFLCVQINRIKLQNDLFEGSFIYF